MRRRPKLDMFLVELGSAVGLVIFIFTVLVVLAPFGGRH